MRPLLFAIGSILFASTLTLGVPAHAQSGGSSAGQSQKADDLFHKGKALYQAAKVREAYEAYAAAWGLKRSYDIAANLANTEMLLGLKRDAAEHLTYCARNFPPSGNKAQLDAIKARFDEARKEVGALVVKGLAPGAALQIDGKEVGAGAFADELYVEPGKHVIDVKLAGYEDTQQAFDVKAGGSVSVELMQKKIEAARPVALQPTRSSPSALSRGPNTPVVVGGAAISLAALGAGVALVAVASGKRTDADQMVSQLKSASAPFCAKAATTGACGDLFSLRQDQGTFHNTGIALLVGGSVVAAGTVAYALWPRGKQATREAWIVPVVGTDGAGVWLRGAF